MDEPTRKRLAEIERQRSEWLAKFDDLDREEARLLEQALRHIQANPSEKLKRRLRRREQSAKVVNSAVELAPAHRIAISKGRKGKSPFLDAVRASGYTLRGLAEAVGCLPSLLSMYRSSDEPRPIPRDRAEAIEKLTGWPADAKHWPGGIS